MTITPFWDLNKIGPQRHEGDVAADRLDAADAKRYLRDHAPEWVPELFRNGIISRDKSELRLANIRGDRPRDKGSCVIQLRGDNAGSWHDFDGADGGGPLDCYMRARGLGFVEALAEVALMMGKRPKSTIPTCHAAAWPSVMLLAEIEADLYASCRRLEQGEPPWPSVWCAGCADGHIGGEKRVSKWSFIGSRRFSMR